MLVLDDNGNPNKSCNSRRTYSGGGAPHSRRAWSHAIESGLQRCGIHAGNAGQFGRAVDVAFCSDARGRGSFQTSGRRGAVEIGNRRAVGVEHYDLLDLVSCAQGRDDCQQNVGIILFSTSVFAGRRQVGKGLQTVRCCTPGSLTYRRFCGLVLLPEHAEIEKSADERNQEHAYQHHLNRNGTVLPTEPFGEGAFKDGEVPRHVPT